MVYKLVKKQEDNQPPTEKLAIDELINNVVNVLKPQMDIAINAKFDEIKTLFVNEMRDIRAQQPQPEFNQPPQLQQPMVSPVPQQQPMDLMTTILPLISNLIKPQESSNSMSNLLAEAMMRKMLSDTSRSEVLNQAVMNFMFKQIFKDENALSEYNKTADTFMSPITKFGSIKEKTKNTENT